MLFEITVTCAGCGTCVKRCPAGAISGERRAQHHIDPSLCKECGACWRQCPKAAVISPAGVLRQGKPVKELPKARVDPSACAGCRNCLLSCPFRIIEVSNDRTWGLSTNKCCVVGQGCWGCETCVTVCPTGAVSIVPEPVKKPDPRPTEPRRASEEAMGARRRAGGD
jgi:electron transport complex protein RnfB